MLALALYHPWATPQSGSTARPALIAFNVVDVPVDSPRAADPPSARGRPHATPELPRVVRQGAPSPVEPRAQVQPVLDAQVASGGAAQAALTGAQADPGLAEEYRNAVRNHVSRFVFYPQDAATVRLRGTVTLHLALLRNGQVRNVWIERSAGADTLDAAALVAIQRAAPMPPIPAGLPDTLELALPIDFSSATIAGLQHAANR